MMRTRINSYKRNGGLIGRSQHREIFKNLTTLKWFLKLWEATNEWFGTKNVKHENGIFTYKGGDEYIEVNITVKRD